MQEQDTEMVKEFTDRILKVVNQLRVLGEELSDKRVVEKVLVSLPERFESKISSLEESRDLSKITVAEFINALQATEQRRSIRQEEATVESALLAKQKGKAQMVQTVKKQIGGGRGKVKYQESPRKEGEKKKIGPCFHCGKDGHTAKFCWFRPNVQCRWCKQLGHVEKVCKNKGARVQQAHQAHLPEDEVQQSEEKLFVLPILQQVAAMIIGL